MTAGGPERDGPPPVPQIARLPRPSDPGPSATSPTVGPATRARLDDADRRWAATLAADEPGSHLRRTIALAIAAGALGAAWRLLGPGRVRSGRDGRE